MSLWSNIRQSAGNWADSLGTALGLPETGFSEKIAGGATTNTKMGGLGTASAMTPAANQSKMPPGIYDSSGKQIGSSNTVQYSNTPSGGNSGGGGGGNKTKIGNLDAMTNVNGENKTYRSAIQEGLMDEYGNMINQGSNDQQAAAERAAEARRRAAEAKYNAQKGIAQEAKGMAKEAYDWLVDTIGSNKQDLLSQVALQGEQGMRDYQLQEDKTRTDYDRAKQDILGTYRDLQTQQEKILRGSGMSSSSRSQEAQLRLNNLLGKDLSTVRTNEADSLAMIGNAVTKFKENLTQTNIGIERESTQKLDKAALDYNQQIKSIDANLTLSAAEREEAYAQAEAQLAADSQAITQWATGLKVQAQQFQMQMQGELDNFVADMLDENGLLNTGLEQKRGATNQILTKMGFTPLETNPTTTDPGVGVYQKANMSYKDKESLEAALQRGEITPLDYQKQLDQMQMSSTPVNGVASASPVSPQTGMGINPRATSASRDPLLGALFA